MDLSKLLEFCMAQGASELHLQGGTQPRLRFGGQMRTVEGDKVSAEELDAFLKGLAGGGSVPTSRFAATVPGVARVRVSTLQAGGATTATLRLLPPQPRSLSALGMPPVLEEIASTRRGLTLIVGAGGCGRSTTLAAVVDWFNHNRQNRVVTIERPIEFVHQPDKSLVTQLEIGREITCAADGLKVARDLAADFVAVDGMSRSGSDLLAVLEAVEGGMEVAAVTDGTDAIRSFHRVIETQPPDMRASFKLRLGEVLEAVIALRLGLTREGKPLAVVEVLRGGRLTSELLLANRFDDLARLMAGRQGGMQDFDRQLLALYQANTISGTEAMRLATDPETLASELQARRRA